MNKLEQAARQALEALEELHYSSGTVVAAKMYESATAALREALAEQALSKVTSDEHCKGLGEELYKLAEQVDMNLNCKSVQKRLATSWGYVKAEQQEPIRFVWNGEGWIEADEYIWKTTDDSERRELYALPVQQAEQEPVAIIEKEAGFETEVYATGYADSLPDGVFKLYTAPVRTKDLTDEELWEAAKTAKSNDLTDAFCAVIAADREKNK